MNDSAAVGVAESTCGLQEVLEFGVEWNSVSPLDLRQQVLAGQILLDQKGLVVFDPEVVDPSDVGVVEAGCELRLAEEALPAFSVAESTGFHGDRTLEVRIAGFVDDSETAFGDSLDHFVFADLFGQNADHRNSSNGLAKWSFRRFRGR